MPAHLLPTSSRQLLEDLLSLTVYCTSYGFACEELIFSIQTNDKSAR